MGYVMTSDELAALQNGGFGTVYENEYVAVNFMTSSDFLREVLPPCFEVPSSPRAYAQIGISRSPRYEYGSASINVMARYGDIEGWYHLSLLMTGDMPVVIGRELWGEAKKLCEEVTFAAESDNGVHGRAVRNGMPLMTVSGKFGADQGERTTEPYYGFNIKGFLNSSATDLQHNPIVCVRRGVDEISVYHEAEVDLKLRSTREDPCASIPIIASENAVYAKSVTTVEAVGEYEAQGSREYVPYFLGRSYDIYRNFDLSEPPSLESIVG